MPINIKDLPNLFYKNTFEVLILNEELLTFCQSNKNWFEDLFKLDFVKKLTRDVKGDIFESARKYYYDFVSPQLSKEDREFLYKTFCSSTFEELKENKKFKEVFFSTYFGFEPIFLFIREQRDKVYSDNINNQDFIDTVNQLKGLPILQENINKYNSYAQEFFKPYMKLMNFIELNLNYFDKYQALIFFKIITNNLSVEDFGCFAFSFPSECVMEKLRQGLSEILIMNVENGN